MKPQPKPRKKTDPVAEKREKGFNVYFQGANKTFADELNFQKKQEETKLKRYQSRNKNVKNQRDSVLSNKISNLPVKANKWASKGRISETAHRSPPIINNRLNNRIKEGDISKDKSKLKREAGDRRCSKPAKAELERL